MVDVVAIWGNPKIMGRCRRSKNGLPGRHETSDIDYENMMRLVVATQTPSCTDRQMPNPTVLGDEKDSMPGRHLDNLI